MLKSCRSSIAHARSRTIVARVYLLFQLQHKELDPRFRFLKEIWQYSRFQTALRSISIGTDSVVSLSCLAVRIATKATTTRSVSIFEVRAEKELDSPQHSNAILKYGTLKPNDSATTTLGTRLAPQ